jgi:hypothetical protein
LPGRSQPGDFEEALGALLGKDAGGLSASTIGLPGRTSMCAGASAISQPRRYITSRLAANKLSRQAPYPPLINTGGNITPPTVFNE